MGASKFDYCNKIAFEWFGDSGHCKISNISACYLVFVLIFFWTILWVALHIERVRIGIFYYFSWLYWTLVLRKYILPISMRDSNKDLIIYWFWHVAHSKIYGWNEWLECNFKNQTIINNRYQFSAIQLV